MIGFLQPLLLAALPLAALPLVLHLMARRDPPTVPFPAVRYLADATREHQRRLRLRHWLLLLLRSLLILALVLAAAGPTLPAGGPGQHAPAAVVIVLDNSPSSAAVAEGEVVLDGLRDAARAALDGATAADALWLMTADGVALRGSAADLRRVTDSLAPGGRRLDLGRAVTTASQVLATEARPGAILVLSDLQATAVTAAVPAHPVVVGRPDGPVPANRGVRSLRTSPLPWTADGGSVRLALTGDSTPAPVRVRLGTLPARQALGAGGAEVEVALPSPGPGWWPLEAELAADELRADDVALGAVRVLPPASVRWDPADRHLAAALAVLADGGRIVAGPGTVLGAPAAGRSVVFPPADPARLGAVNRALADRAAGWHLGPLVEAPALVDSGGLVPGTLVDRRHRLVPEGSGLTGVLATVNGEPWMVEAGGLVLIGSRLDPAWTDLPERAAFVPFLDVLLNRILRGDVVQAAGAPGEPVQLPDRVGEVRSGEAHWAVEGGALFVPPERGLYALLAGGDTVGMLAVNADPLESDLARATDGSVRSLWGRVRAADPGEAAAAVYGEAARAGLRGPLLWIVAVLALATIALGARAPRP